LLVVEVEEKLEVVEVEPAVYFFNNQFQFVELQVIH
jgi:hypothetical protein